MNFDANIINRHIFSEGNIQASPAEVVQLNASKPIPFKLGFLTEPATAGYKVFLSGYANKILLREQKLNFKQAIESGINSLRANPRSITGYRKVGTVDTRKQDIGFFDIWYRINSGQILVYNIVPKKSLRNQRDSLEKTAIYSIRKNAQGIWESKGKVESISTEYAAVNGQSNNLAKATWLMGEHLDFEFGKGRVNEYTLFHNPSVGGGGDTWESVRDKFGATTEVTKEFCKILQNTQKSKHKTKWVAHSQGGIIFAEAVRYHLNGNSSWALLGGFNGRFRQDKGESLIMHSVAFHGNANNNLRSKVLFDRAGVNVIATRAHSYDLVNTVLGANTVNPWRIIGSAVHWNHLVWGSVQQSPHTLMHKNTEEWRKQMDSGPGKGRGPIQKTFNVLDKAGRKGIQYMNNYLK